MARDSSVAIVAVQVCGLSLLGSPQAAYGQEFHGFGVEAYEDAGECCAPGAGSCSDLSHSIDQVQAFDDIVDGWISSGLWTESLETFNGNVDGADWADASREPSWGADSVSNTGVDDADVGYFSGHGGSNCDVAAPHSWIVTGDQGGGDPDECRPQSDNASNTGEWLWGNTDLEMVLLDSCQSMQKCVWDDHGYNNANGTQLLMIAGYHGNSYDTAGQVTALEDYVSTSRLSGVGEHWLDERHIDYPLVGADQCPTVLIWGSNKTNTDDLYHNGGLDDWIDTGTPSMNTYYFIVNCDPQDGPKL